MLVEFIGSTGAGKTTVMRGVQRLLSRSVNTITSEALATGLVGLSHVRQPTIRNLIQEAVAIPFFLSSLPRHRAFLACTLRLLSRDLRPLARTLSELRSLERKLGLHTLARASNADRIVLVDEGPLMTAHMFVGGRRRVTPGEIREFVDTVPLPDVIVYVRAPVETAIARARRRPDPPRDVRLRLGLPELSQYAAGAATLFEELVAALTGMAPILVADNPDDDDRQHAAVLERLASSIHECREIVHDHSRAPQIADRASRVH